MRAVRPRSTRRGSALHSVLATCAIMGCFVYPLSLAIRLAGGRLAQESERGHEVMLRQRR